MSEPLRHRLDLEIEDTDSLDLFAEELPEQVQLMSDCLSTASSFSTAGGCMGCFSTVGSVISCGDAPGWG
jgi:hypothetical protein